jgi:phage/plasmid-like protein (TIGR03299 family)
LPEVIEVGKGIGKTDDVEKYLLLSNAHDGTRPLQMLFTPIRVVCSNTLNSALYERNKEGELKAKAPRVSVQHTENAKKMIKEAERVMAAAYKYYEKFGDFCNFMYSKQLSSNQVENIINEVFPPNKKKEVTPKIQLHRLEVKKLFEDGKGQKQSGVAGSAWALYNGFTEYADHYFAPSKAESQEDLTYSVLLGSSKGLKNKAIKSITEALI